MEQRETYKGECTWLKDLDRDTRGYICYVWGLKEGIVKIDIRKMKKNIRMRDYKFN